MGNFANCRMIALNIAADHPPSNFFEHLTPRDHGYIPTGVALEDVWPELDKVEDGDEIQVFRRWSESSLLPGACSSQPGTKVRLQGREPPPQDSQARHDA